MAQSPALPGWPVVGVVAWVGALGCPAQRPQFASRTGTLKLPAGRGDRGLRTDRVPSRWGRQGPNCPIGGVEALIPWPGRSPPPTPCPGGIPSAFPSQRGPWTPHRRWPGVGGGAGSSCEGMELGRFGGSRAEPYPGGRGACRPVWGTWANICQNVKQK